MSPFPRYSLRWGRRFRLPGSQQSHEACSMRATLTSMVQVVAAVLMRDGKILIGQRKRTGRHPLKWEFPGGKVEPGEDPRAALARELREELNVEAVIGEELDSYEISYRDGVRLMLHFYRVAQFHGGLRNLDFEQLCGINPNGFPVTISWKGILLLCRRCRVAGGGGMT